MPTLKNPNHPKKGSSIKVEPIRSLSDIARLKALLEPCPRDYCLFTLGINTALRANELVKIKLEQVVHLKAGDNLIVKQSKNKKYRTMTINENAYEAIQRCLASHPNRDDMSSPLLYSLTTGKGLRSNTVSKYMKEWCLLIELDGNYSSHTMRKTFGYHAYRRAKKDGTRFPRIAELMIAYGHATERQTLEYLCIQDKDISSLFMESGL